MLWGPLSCLAGSPTLVDLERMRPRDSERVELIGEVKGSQLTRLVLNGQGAKHTKTQTKYILFLALITFCCQ